MKQSLPLIIGVVFMFGRKHFLFWIRFPIYPENLFLKEFFRHFFRNFIKFVKIRV